MSRADAVVLSHGHYDHTGGLDAVMPLLRADVRIFAHPAVAGKRYSVHPPSPSREIGFRGGTEAMRRLKTSREPVEIAPRMLLTGEIPRTNDFEDTGGPFFLDPEGNVPDPILDDQALIIESDAGVILVVGCAHAGIVNTLEHARSLVHCEHFAAVIGGMHLGAASPDRLNKTMLALRCSGVQFLGPAHCTGQTAISLIARESGSALLDCRVGATLEF